MALKEKSRKDLATDLGISYYTVTDWVNGKKYPRMDKVEILANYFGCLKSDLIEDKTKQPVENELSEVKQALIELVESLSENEATVLLASLKSGLGR
jgi:transcriptional regulator with XRE-family HTH domain